MLRYPISLFHVGNSPLFRSLGLVSIFPYCKSSHGCCIFILWVWRLYICYFAICIGVFHECLFSWYSSMCLLASVIFWKVVLDLCSIWQLTFIAQNFHEGDGITCLNNEFQLIIFIRISFSFPAPGISDNRFLHSIYIILGMARWVQNQLNDHVVSGYSYNVIWPCFPLIFHSPQKLSSAWSSARDLSVILQGYNSFYVVQITG
jgi:hypothetical protein